MDVFYAIKGAFKLDSIEYARPLSLKAENPFESEIALYSKIRRAQDISVLVCVPDFYHVALPNLGHQIVEFQINQLPGFYASRCYLDTNFNLLRESDTPPNIVVISMSYEGSYIRAIRILDRLGLKPLAEERPVGDPLVIIGGRSVSINPLPLFKIADVIAIGDSDQLIQSICQAFQNNRGKSNSFFDAIVQHTGVIVPQRYSVTTSNGYLDHWEAHNAPTDIYPNRSNFFPHSWYLSSETDYNAIGYYNGKTFFSIEIVKACASKCLFCAEGFNNGSMRFTSDVEVITDKALWGQRYGADLTKLFFPCKFHTRNN